MVKLGVVIRQKLGLFQVHLLCGLYRRQHAAEVGALALKLSPHRGHPRPYVPKEPPILVSNLWCALISKGGDVQTPPIAVGLIGWIFDRLVNDRLDLKAAGAAYHGSRRSKANYFCVWSKTTLSNEHHQGIMVFLLFSEGHEVLVDM